MILVLDLDKSYGIQNEDIAKKNKINKITLSINSIKESDNYDNAIQETINITSDSNTQTKIVATNFSQKDNERFSSYIGAVEYKIYTVSLDLTQSKYEALKTAKKAVPYTEVYTGNRAVRNMKEYEIYAFGIYDSFKRELEEIDIVSRMAAFKYTSASGTEVNLWSSEIDFVLNKYMSKEGDQDIENDVVTEWSTIIQTANDTIKEQNDFQKLSQLAKTKITEWNNDGNTLTFSIQVPYGIYFWVCNDVYDIGRITINFDTIYNASPIIWTRYLISSATLSLTTSLDIETEDVTYFDGNREYSANQSFMFTKGNTVSTDELPSMDYAENFSTQIYDAYNNGKLEVKIKYPVGNVFDNFGNLVLYSANYGLVRNLNGEYYDEDGKKVEMVQDESLSSIVPLTEGAICELVKSGEPIYKKPDGTEQYFLIQSSNMSYTGFLLNDLTLIESTEDMPEYTLTVNLSNIVTRLSSPIVGAKTGVLNNKDKIYEGDELQISTTRDIRTYTIKNAGKTVASGSAIYGGETINLTVAGNVSVNIVYMAWHWADHGSKNSYNTVEFDSQSTIQKSWNDIYSLSQGGSVNGLIASNENKKYWHIRPYYFNAYEAYNGNYNSQYPDHVYPADWFEIEGQDYLETFTEINCVGSGCSLSINHEPVPTFFFNTGGFVNDIAFDVKTNGEININNVGYFERASGSGYYDNYIKKIDIWVTQWEYS